MLFHVFSCWNTEIVATSNSPLVKTKLSARQGHEYTQSVSSLIEIHLLSMNVYVGILHTDVHRFISCSILLFLSVAGFISEKKRPSELIVIKAFSQTSISSEAKSEFINKLSLMKIDEWQHMEQI